MRISDWSSDVCSSDLPDPLLDRVAIGEHLFEVGVFKAKRPGQLVKAAVVLELAQVVAAPRAPPHHMMARSEERRVGKECVSKCRSRWTPYHLKKTKLTTEK